MDIKPFSFNNFLLPLCYSISLLTYVSKNLPRTATTIATKLVDVAVLRLTDINPVLASAVAHLKHLKIDCQLTNEKGYMSAATLCLP